MFRIELLKEVLSSYCSISKHKQRQAVRIFPYHANA